MLPALCAPKTLHPVALRPRPVHVRAVHSGWCPPPAPSISLYLGRSCSTFPPLSPGDGRGTQRGRSPAGSPGGRPGRCTGCRAGVQRSERLDATPPRASTSSHRARRLGPGGQRERRVGALDSSQSQVIGGGGALESPCSTVWPSHMDSKVQARIQNRPHIPDTPLPPTISALRAVTCSVRTC